MERGLVHKCKVCLKRFSNGRALGGHMRSHMVNVAPPHGHHLIMSDSAPSSSEGDGDGDDDEEEKGLCYGLRENPKRSIRMVDPEFSFAASVVVQDRESETESSRNPTPRRSKRRMRMTTTTTPKPHYNNNNNVYNQKEKESWTEAEAALSSISGSTTEEDVAFCLMMLSRDKWTTTTTRRRRQQQQQEDDDESMEEEESDGSDSDDSQGLKLSKNRNKRGSYECETCNKVFGSYQALGGHRASHKKIKVLDQRINATTISRQQIKKIHECPVCFRVFASGQALGGHKRSHVAAFSTPLKIPPTRQSFIDLNLPAPFDEDDLSSALSDADFVNNNNNNNAIRH